MKSLISLLCLVVLAGCTGQAPINETYVVQPNSVCRVGLDGGPTAADRGTGGTGGPDTRAVADRGIGGTGIQRLGVVGIVTGFASICVDGLDVQYDTAARIDIDGVAATAAQLRAGQLVVIDALEAPSVPNAMPSARHISVRSEVTGPVESIEAGAHAMKIAGQRVMVTPETWGVEEFRVGDWIKVSGLRQADQTIVASRLDPAFGKPLVVRGPVTWDGSSIRIGSLLLQMADVTAFQAGQPVSVSGIYTAGAVKVTAMAKDGLAADPTHYFGDAPARVVMQAFIRVEHGAVVMNDRVHFPVGPALKLTARRSGDAIVVLERRADGSFVASDLRFTDFRGQSKMLVSSSRGVNRTGSSGVNDQAAESSAGTRGSPPGSPAARDGSGSADAAGDAPPVQPGSSLAVPGTIGPDADPIQDGAQPTAPVSSTGVPADPTPWPADPALGLSGPAPSQTAPSASLAPATPPAPLRSHTGPSVSGDPESERPLTGDTCKAACLTGVSVDASQLEVVTRTSTAVLRLRPKPSANSAAD